MKYHQWTPCILKSESSWRDILSDQRPTRSHGRGCDGLGRRCEKRINGKYVIDAHLRFLGAVMHGGEVFRQRHLHEGRRHFSAKKPNKTDGEKQRFILKNAEPPGCRRPRRRKPERRWVLGRWRPSKYMCCSFRLWDDSQWLLSTKYIGNYNTYTPTSEYCVHVSSENTTFDSDTGFPQFPPQRVALLQVYPV